MGEREKQIRDNPYDQKYAGQEYYWGMNPSVLCDKVLEIIRPGPNFHPKLLDIGCGEGRNAVYFAKHGFEVTGLDLSLVGLEKTKRYAEQTGVQVNTIHADVITYELEDMFDVIFSTGTLHYLPPAIRKERFCNYKEHTSNGGIIAISVLVEKPFIPRAPDAEETAFHFKSGELMSYFWDWEILYAIEEIFDCMSSGIPHKHAVNRIIAKKVLC